MKLDNNQQFNEFNMRRMKFESDRKWKRERILEIQNKLRSKNFVVSDKCKYTTELEYLENLEKMVDEGHMKSGC